MDAQSQAPHHLAWHETLEMHELAAMQAHCLMDFKMALPQVRDPALRALYTEAIQNIEQNLMDLAPFYPLAPIPPAPVGAPAAPRADLTAFYGAKLLIFAKTAVRNYAIAITEAATPAVRETFQRHLLKAIHLHGRAFAFMYQRSYYPAYQLDRLLANDLKIAQQALSM